MQKDNSGAIFKNDKREKGTHPHYNGSAMIDGVEYWVSSWINESKGGKKYMSLSFKEKEGQAPTPSKKVSELDDDIPF